MRKSYKLLALLCAAALLLSLAGCGSGAKSEDPYSDIPASTGGKDIERAEMADDIFSLNSNNRYSYRPLVATNHANQLICSLVYENMIELDNDFEVIEGAGLITEWSVSEDGRSWTFTVDTTHTFHDGSAVGGADLRRSLESAIYADRFRGRFASVQGVSHSENKMYVTLGIANTQFVKLLNIPVCKAGTFGDDHPLGSGPYMWSEDGSKLLAYTGHNGYDRLPVEEIYIKEYTDAASILSAYEDALIDVVLNDPSSSTNLGYSSSNEERAFATTNMHYVAFNEESALGRYSNIRTALSYGFDRSYFADELMRGNAVAASVPMYPTCKAYPADLADDNEYDLDRCKLILENYGIRDYDEDGKLEFSSGNNADLTMTMIVASDSSIKAGMVRHFAEDMAKIGLTIDVRELSWDDYLTALEEGRLEDDTEFDMYYAEVKLRNDFDLTELLQVRNKNNESTNINFTRSTDRVYETYIYNYLAASDMDRANQYRILAQYILTNGDLIPIGFEKQEVITHRGVCKGVDPNMGNPLYNFPNWEIDLEKRD